MIVTRLGVTRATSRIRDPALSLALPISFAVLAIAAGYDTSTTWRVGFDFYGTLWEPARAVLHGTPVYAEPTAAEIEVGNPSVYPPLPILLSIPFALLPAAAAGWAWLVVLAIGVGGAIRLLGVTDWRCIVIGITSPVVLHGLVWGNLTLLLLVPVALAWRYRDRAPVVGLAVGAAIALKFLVWPLIVWLWVTGRRRAALIATAWAGVLLLLPWAILGFEGIGEYPSVLGALNDVYALHSVSLPTFVGGLGASGTVATASCAVAGISLLAVVTWLGKGAHADRRAFSVAVVASIAASPIVWPHYAALLIVPIAVTWPRLAPAWFAGYGVWLAGLLLQFGWSPWDAFGTLAVVATVGALLVISNGRHDSLSVTDVASLSARRAHSHS
jgi:Glycosyltransferase family 87